MTPTESLPFPCVVFDLDGTLLDTRQAMLAAINALLYEMGRQLVDVQQIGHSTHLGMSAMLHSALAKTGEVPASARLQQLESLLRDRYLASAGTSVRCFPDARELLEMLLARGAWLAICSNQDEASVRTLLGSFGMLGFFRQIVGGDTLLRRKPDPMPLRWIIELAGTCPMSVVMVGDSELDAQCAARSGTAAVIMTHGYGGGGIASPHLAVPDFASLAKLLLPRGRP